VGKRTPLYDLHLSLGARMVDFGGWNMPVHYGSQVEEHHAVRTAAGVFDVSHMCSIDLKGGRTREFLRRLLANDVARLTQPGKALYSCLLNEQGGVLDDLIVYFLSDSAFRMVVNAGTRDKDLEWIRLHAAAFDVEVVERTDLAMLAVQGPEARERTADLLPASLEKSALALAPFFAREEGSWLVARTGYTGEDGFEITLPADEAEGLWRRLNENEVVSCGLGARDTLRLEAGMNLYGNDMDESTSPLESGLAWTVAVDPPDRAFIGREALETLRRNGPRYKQAGLLLEDRGVLRAHQAVIAADGARGETTSGTNANRRTRSIALARVPLSAQGSVQVDIRGKLLRARIVKPPFVRNGKPMVSLS